MSCPALLPLPASASPLPSLLLSAPWPLPLPLPASHMHTHPWLAGWLAHPWLPPGRRPFAQPPSSAAHPAPPRQAGSPLAVGCPACLPRLCVPCACARMRILCCRAPPGTASVGAPARPLLPSRTARLHACAARLPGDCFIYTLFLIPSQIGRCGFNFFYVWNDEGTPALPCSCTAYVCTASWLSGLRCIHCIPACIISPHFHAPASRQKVALHTMLSSPAVLRKYTCTGTRHAHPCHHCFACCHVSPAADNRDRDCGYRR
jgi:hypothetical protein